MKRVPPWGVTAGLWLAGLGAAQADSWLPPCPAVYTAPAGAYRLIVMPSGCFDPASCRNPGPDAEFAGRPRAADRASGTLERRVGTGWETVWQRDLAHRVSPASAAVSDTGRVATFDNWHAVGWGDNVVALYDPHGRLMRQMGLTDFLPRFYVHALPSSVSSIWWGGDHAFTPDGQWLQLNVVVPAADPTAQAPGSQRPPLVQVMVDADTGRVTPPQGPAWDQALARARQADAVLCTEERAMFQQELAPLVAPPAAAPTPDWHRYGHGVLRRLRPEAASELPDETCVFSATDLAEDANRVTRCVRGAVEAAADTPQEVLLLAPDPAALWAVVQPVLMTLPPQALRGSRLFVAATPAAQDHVTRTLSVLGAAVTVFDPAQPLPLPAAARAQWLSRFDPRDGRDAMGVCGPEARPGEPQ
ncbi:MAG: hypothetical protein EKK53_27495 [Burkholderiales bacterium]|nr:MAG: hypothetical protein EKK53_27495 [Burkholderiales bacterium]